MSEESLRISQKVIAKTESLNIIVPINENLPLPAAMTTTAALSLALPATPAKACTRSVDLASAIAAVSCVVALLSFVATQLVG